MECFNESLIIYCGLIIGPASLRAADVSGV
jgi:hypothetical protein